MKPNQLRQIGKTSLQVTQFGLGGTALGNIYSAVEEQALLFARGFGDVLCARNVTSYGFSQAV